MRGRRAEFAVQKAFRHWGRVSGILDAVTAQPLHQVGRLAVR